MTRTGDSALDGLMIPIRHNPGMPAPCGVGATTTHTGVPPLMSSVSRLAPGPAGCYHDS
jgi:hypothetical protein